MKNFNKQKMVLRLIEAVMNKDNKKADKALKSIVNNNIGAKIQRAEKTESLL